jgi:bacterial/archaeal transporter family protein
MRISSVAAHEVSTSMTKVVPADKWSLLLVAVFAVMFLHERPTLQEGVGILLVSAGVLILGLKR